MGSDVLGLAGFAPVLHCSKALTRHIECWHLGPIVTTANPPQTILLCLLSLQVKKLLEQWAGIFLGEGLWREQWAGCVCSWGHRCHCQLGGHQLAAGADLAAHCAERDPQGCVALLLPGGRQREGCHFLLHYQEPISKGVCGSSCLKKCLVLSPTPPLIRLMPVILSWTGSFSEIISYWWVLEHNRE